MKKILSTLLVAAMLLSLVIVATVPAAAVRGDWSVYTAKSQYLDDYNDIMRSIPGYEYTDEGLKMVVEEGLWADSAPYATVQTTDTVDLREGVYMQVRVDDFTYTSPEGGSIDKWFAFSIWDQENVEPGKVDDNYGYGVETLIRIDAPSPVTEEGQEPEIKGGSVAHLEWNKDVAANQRICVKTQNKKDSAMANFNNFDENGKPILTLEVVWSDADEQCIIYINGVMAPDEYISAMNAYFAERDYQGYVGFSLQNGQKGGTVACTVLKFGTSADTATIPAGDDHADPIKNTNEVAELSDGSDVEEGEPAILMTGDRNGSDILGKPSSTQGCAITITDDYNVKVTSNESNQVSVTYKVANSASYSTETFPIMLIITKNFCTCTYQDTDGDGIPNEECACGERFNVLGLAGDVIAENSKYAVNTVMNMWSPDYDDEGNSYLYFTADWSTIAGLSGRIHGARIDCFQMKGTDPNRNAPEFCEVGFFRTEEEAAAYYQAFISEIINSSDTPVVDETTEAPVVDTEEPTEAPVVDTEEPTSAPTEAPTQAPVVEDPTQAPAVEDPTEAAPKTEEPKSGCGSVVGIGAIAVVAFAAAGLVSFKKKED